MVLAGEEQETSMALSEFFLGLVVGFAMLALFLRLLLEKLTQKNYEFIHYWVNLSVFFFGENFSSFFFLLKGKAW